MGNETKGFASLGPERRRFLASLGGKAVQKKGSGHRFTTETGRKAGKIGGRISRRGPARDIPDEIA